MSAVGMTVPVRFGKRTYVCGTFLNDSVILNGSARLWYTDLLNYL